MTNPSGPDDDTRIRMMHGGPFYDLMSAIGLRQRVRRAFAFGSLSFLVPLLILLTSANATSFLADWGAWAKFFAAPVLFTLTEQPIGFAIDQGSSILLKTPLVADRSMADARAALAAAKERTVAWLPEAVCLLLAVLASLLNFESFRSMGSAPSWAAFDGGLTAGGLWCVVVSNTLYWFLLARLVWKHIVWSGFLRSVANCRLRLAVTHPDGHGGLGMLGLYPAGYGLFTLGVSCVAAAGIGHVMQRETVTTTLFTVVCAGWLLVVVSYYGLPMLGLSIAIGRVKQKALMLSLVKATDFERHIERALLGENIVDDDAEGETEVRDVKPIYQASLKTSVFILNKANILPIVVPALLPLLAVGATYLSYSQLGPIMKRLLFL